MLWHCAIRKNVLSRSVLKSAKLAFESLRSDRGCDCHYPTTTISLLPSSIWIGEEGRQPYGECSYAVLLPTSYGAAPVPSYDAAPVRPLIYHRFGLLLVIDL